MNAHTHKYSILLCCTLQFHKNFSLINFVRYISVWHQLLPTYSFMSKWWFPFNSHHYLLLKRKKFKQCQALINTWVYSLSVIHLPYVHIHMYVRMHVCVYFRVLLICIDIALFFAIDFAGLLCQDNWANKHIELLYRYHTHRHIHMYIYTNVYIYLHMLLIK